MSTPAFAWPEGRRVAVIVSVLLETWSEGKAPSYFPRTTPNKPGIPDIAGINWSTYGGKEGVWRLARILDEVGLKATLFCNGRSAELYPDAVAQFVRAGHDVAGSAGPDATVNAGGVASQASWPQPKQSPHSGGQLAEQSSAQRSSASGPRATSARAPSISSDRRWRPRTAPRLAHRGCDLPARPRDRCCLEI